MMYIHFHEYVRKIKLMMKPGDKTIIHDVIGTFIFKYRFKELTNTA